jgi:hypothetical protein
MKQKKRNSILSVHTPKSREERNDFIQIIREMNAEPTLPGGQEEGTLGGDRKPDTRYDTDRSTRKNGRNRFILHIKESWPNYLIGALSVIGVYFFITSNVRLAEINKDISYQSEKLADNTQKIEKVAEDVSSFHADLKSLNDRFSLFIELFRQSDK